MLTIFLTSLRLLVLGCAWVASAAASADDTSPAAGDATRGARVYRQFCQHCHGLNLINPGTASFDLRRLQADEYPRFSNSVMNGKGNMPPWKGTLKDGDLDSLWAYIMGTRNGG